MSAHISPMPAQPLAFEQEGILPTLFGEGYGTYKSKPGAFIASYACNLLVTILLVWSGHWFVQHRQDLSRGLSGLIDQATYLLPSPTQAGGGGVGPGNGAGVGPGSDANMGGGAYRPGGGVTAPRAIYQPEPEYSDEARKAKFQGSVVLWLVVGPDGHPREVKVVRSLGMGLDEKALETVRTWHFEPGRKDGLPVAVQVHVEVIFHLY